jgi:phosphoribosylformylglycinamidine synthase subunit PurQ / glutaminase
VHVNEIIKSSINLSDYEILALPGGFSYGDDVAAGKILANELIYKLKKRLIRFINDGKLIIGICNGFQVLVKAGILPGNSSFRQEVSLTTNDSGKFEDRWTYLRGKGEGLNRSKCVWAKGLSEIVYLPVAHGEGKFICQDKKTLKDLHQNNQVVFQYCDSDGVLSGYPDNPNGSWDNIAGIVDKTGRIFGLMPHPERHILPTQHPRWTREGLRKEGDGFLIFKNGIEYARRHL